MARETQRSMIGGSGSGSKKPTITTPQNKSSRQKVSSLMSQQKSNATPTQIKQTAVKPVSGITNIVNPAKDAHAKAHITTPPPKQPPTYGTRSIPDRPYVAPTPVAKPVAPPTVTYRPPANVGTSAPTVTYRPPNNSSPTPSTSPQPSTAPTSVPTNVPTGDTTGGGAVDNGQANMGAQNLGTTIDGVMSGFQNTIAEVSQMGNEGLAALAAQWEAMDAMLSQMEETIMGQIRGQMGADDPAMQSALGLIREEVARQKQGVLEELNARGLAQSGVVGEMLDRLNSGELTQIQQLVGQRVGDLQNQLNSALMAMAQMRIQALSQNQGMAAQFQQANIDRMASMGAKMSELGMQGAGLTNQWNIANMQNDTQKYGIDKNYASSIYGTNKGYEASIYGADKSAESSKYNADLDYKASRYSADQGYAAAKLSADKQLEIAKMKPQMNIQEEYQIGMNEVMTTITNAQAGKIPAGKKELLADLDQSPYSPMVKEAMKSKILQSGLPDTVGKVTSKSTSQSVLGSFGATKMTPTSKNMNFWDGLKLPFMPILR